MQEFRACGGVLGIRGLLEFADAYPWSKKPDSRSEADVSVPPGPDFS